jgi:hypothetical protein
VVRPWLRDRRLLTAAAAAAGLALVGCTGPAPVAGSAPASSTSSASVQLGELAVRAEDTGAHYRRADWGDWSYVGDGCDTREVVLREQGHGVISGKGCVPVCPQGAPPCWVSPYDGLALDFRGDVQLDHRVPIKEALRSGARGWNFEQRDRFYNDHANLVAVSVHANTSKGDRDPGRWRPSNRDGWCSYATGYIATKHTYGLSVDQGEHDALVDMLRTCGGQNR